MSLFVGCWICRVGERPWRFGGLAAETLLQCANCEVTREQTICYPIRIFGDDQHGGDLPRVYVGRSGSTRKRKMLVLMYGASGPNQNRNSLKGSRRGRFSIFGQREQYSDRP